MDTEPELTPRRGVHAFFFDDQCILFSESHQTAIELNATAGVIWSLLCEGRNRSQIIDELRESFAVDQASAQYFVDSAFQNWLELDFLGEPTASAHSPPPDRRRPPSLRQAPGAGAQVFAISGTRFAIQFATDAQAALVWPSLDHLAVDYSDPVDASIEVLEGQNRLQILVDGRPSLECGSLEELTPLIKGIVWAEAVNRSDFLFGFHAGAVATSSGALLLPGQSGSGKSTLTTHLVADGMYYLSDEMAMLCEPDLSVRRLPLSICVKDTGAEVVASLFPEVRSLTFHQRGDGKRVAYLRPPVSGDGAGELQTVAALVFPTFTPGAGTQLEPMSTGEAVRRLLTECLAAGRPLRNADIKRLVDWVDTRSRRRLIFGSAEEATKCLVSFMSNPASRTA